jgi:hypothetical protein
VLERALLLATAAVLLAGCSPFSDPWWSHAVDSLGVGDPPAFPDTVERWSYDAGCSDMTRAFVGENWTAASGPNYDVFPATMNGCDSQRFLVRWRSAGVAVQAAAVDAIGSAYKQVSGESGWMDLSGCYTPAFRLAEPTESGSTLVDVVVEVQQYRPAV